MDFEAFTLAWLICALACACLGFLWRRNPFGWFVAGMLTGPIAVVALAVVRGRAGG